MKPWQEKLTFVLVLVVLLGIAVNDFLDGRSDRRAAEDRFNKSHELTLELIRALGEQRLRYVVTSAQQQLELWALLEVRNMDAMRQLLSSQIQASEVELKRHDPSFGTDEVKQEVSDIERRITEYRSKSRGAIAP